MIKTLKFSDSERELVNKEEFKKLLNVTLFNALFTHLDIKFQPREIKIEVDNANDIICVKIVKLEFGTNISYELLSNVDKDNVMQAGYYRRRVPTLDSHIEGELVDSIILRYKNEVQEWYNSFKPRLNFIGRGSAFNTKEGNNSAFLINGKNMILFDCGGTVFEKLKTLKILDIIGNVMICITHLHSDHIGSLSCLIAYLNYAKNIKPMLIYDTNQHAKLDSILLAQSITYDMYTTEFDSEFLKNMYIYKITAISTNHFETNGIYDPNSMTTVYKVLFNDDTSLTYATDINNIPHQLVKDLENESNILYIDTSISYFKNNPHLNLHDTARIIKPEYRHRVFCMHIDDSKLTSTAEEYGFNVVHQLGSYFNIGVVEVKDFIKTPKKENE